MIPTGILNHVGIDNMNQLKQLAENLQVSSGLNNVKKPLPTVAEEDDDVPDLVANFEEVSKS